MALNAWWLSWRAKGPAVDGFPGDEDFVQLHDTLDVLVHKQITFQAVSPQHTEENAVDTAIVPTKLASPLTVSPTSYMSKRQRTSISTSHPTILPSSLSIATIPRTLDGSPRICLDGTPWPSGEQSAPVPMETHRAQLSEITPVGYVSTPEIWPVDKAETEVHLQSLTVVHGTATCVVEVGQSAARALLVQVVAAQRSHAQQVYRHGQQPFTGRNVPLDERLAKREFHTQHGPPPRPTSEGNDLGLLFRIFLGNIHERGYTSRMPVLPTN